MASAPGKNTAKDKSLLFHDFVSQRNNLVEKCLYLSIGLRENSTSDDSEKAVVGTRNVEDVLVSVKQQKNYLKNSQGEFLSLETFSTDKCPFCVKTELFSPKVLVQKKSNVFNLVPDSNYRRHLRSTLLLNVNN